MEWISIKPQDLIFADAPTPAPIDNNEPTVRSFISPYDLPMAIRPIGRKDGSFTIDFKYIEDEPFDFIKEGQGIWLGLGKTSGRLIAVRLDPNDAPDTSLASIAEMMAAIEKLKNDPTRKNIKRKNYEIAEQILNDKKSVIGPIYLKWHRGNQDV